MIFNVWDNPRTIILQDTAVSLYSVAAATTALVLCVIEIANNVQCVR